ncbi:hydroxymethylglutaryl-CoA lyase [Lacihabitans sp. CCS-44]|uniref:hydroxymethylglutaryl-CoA lyase n=1 Tax=Lacihabitans sp. CCS-44 TaxID=2487331 RepID=UPI0020CE3CAF|nr:hydroxymethylglutaryl-CoA lyase [Lacihabitans sp. CCS-44]MCP9755705.1 hydroxymethylglutaryl-CoA lyase [Lacihabitans sp. CCS-44]
MPKKSEEIILVDCPRDAIQGISRPISAQKKADHINKLLESEAFDWIDFGSFVSPKAVPQMSDTAEVLKLLDFKNKKTKLLAIVVNEKGAETASLFPEVTYLGYPFSISESFQKRNTNAGIEESFIRLKNINEIAKNAGKEVVVYISMAFGNPYGDVWSQELVVEWIGKITALGIKEFSLADTTAEAEILDITTLFKKCIHEFPELRIGSHFHSKKEDSLVKIKAAYAAGCRKFDGALMGYGGCPFAKDDLVGNIPSEELLDFFERKTDILALKNSFMHLIS